MGELGTATLVPTNVVSNGVSQSGAPSEAPDRQYRDFR
jgi:hypothetical protein